MKKRATQSISARFVTIGAASIVVVAAVAIATSLFFFRLQIEELYLRDFRSRVQAIEFEYADVDAVSAASSEVSRLRNELLERLRRRFEDQKGAAPLIFNGDNDIILWPTDFEADLSLVQALKEAMDGEQTVSQVLETSDGPYWFLLEYYEGWDWFTAYAVSNSERFAVLTRFLVILGLATTVLIAIAIFAYLLIVRRLLAPLRSVGGALEDYTAGDLRSRIPVRSRDEVGAIAEGVNEFAERLSGIVRSIQVSARQNIEIEAKLRESSAEATEVIARISDSTRSISDQVDQLSDLTVQSGASVSTIKDEIGRLSQRIEEQFAAVTQSTASIEEMSASLRNVAAITKTKRASSERLMQTARDGGERLGRTTEAVQTLMSRVDSIAEFVAIIQKVASQTNLLAMNAAIEAAHAGEAGRGFAVVADEIRKLAEEAATHSSSTSASLKEIVDTVRQAAESGQETQKAFDEIEQEVQTVVSSLDEIAASAAELSTGSGEIMNAMQVLQTISSDVMSGSQTVQSEAESVSGAINDLTELSGHVRTASVRISEDADSASSDMASVSTVAKELRDSSEELRGRVAIFTTDRETDQDTRDS